jgi:hypothetical protein
MVRRPALARGAFRDRHERWAQDAVDVTGSQHVVSHATNETATYVKSCGPGAPMLALSSGDDRLDHPSGDGG